MTKVTFTAMVEVTGYGNGDDQGNSVSKSDGGNQG